MLLINENIKKILDLLQQNGHEAYLVGGCVRDFYMDKIPYDIDITTSATCEQIKNVFCEECFKIYTIGEKFFTICVEFNKKYYEITTFRKESDYFDFRHPKKIEFATNLKEDLKRRDFTINALAFSEITGIIDCFGGVADIRKKLIKTVGDPDERFLEDPLRIIRGVRFSILLDFNIEENTKKSIIKFGKLIENVSVERKNSELVKIICSNNLYGFKQLYTLNLLIYIYPLFNQIVGNDEKFNKICEKVLQISEEQQDLRQILFFSLLFCEIIMKNDEIIKSFCKNNKFSKFLYTEIKMFVYILNFDLKFDIYLVKKLLKNVGLSRLEIFLNFHIFDEHKHLFLQKKINEIKTRNHPYLLKHLALNGEDVNNLGYSGIYVGKILQECLDYVTLNPEKNKKNILLNFIKDKNLL